MELTGSILVGAWWLIKSALWLAWSLAWLLLGGWVSTLMQIAVVVLVVLAYKHGWRRAPAEALALTKPLLERIWAWMRRREPRAAAISGGKGRPGRGTQRRRQRQPGDVNLSTIMNLAVLLGLAALAAG